MLPKDLVVAVGCKWLSRPNVSGVWRRSIEGTASAGTTAGARRIDVESNTGMRSPECLFSLHVQVPVSKDSLTFSGQNQFQMASIELTFHGKVSDTTLSGAADMTSRSMFSVLRQKRLPSVCRNNRRVKLYGCSTASPLSTHQAHNSSEPCQENHHQRCPTVSRALAFSSNDAHD
jgi:hypothetical protein